MEIVLTFVFYVGLALAILYAIWGHIKGIYHVGKYGAGMVFDRCLGHTVIDGVPTRVTFSYVLLVIAYPVLFLGTSYLLIATDFSSAGIILGAVFLLPNGLIGWWLMVSDADDPMSAILMSGGHVIAGIILVSMIVMSIKDLR